MNQIEVLMTLDKLLEATEEAEKLVRHILIAKKAGTYTALYDDIEYSCCMVRQDITSIRAELKERAEKVPESLEELFGQTNIPRKQNDC